MTRMRTRIAERLMQSKNSIAMLTSFNEVNLAKVSSDTAWIASGVRAGQEVVTAGVHLLRDGQTVRRLTHDPAQPVGTQAK